MNGAKRGKIALPRPGKIGDAKRGIARPNAGMPAGRGKLLAMFAVAAAPLVLAYLFYFASQRGMEWGTTNEGRLLDPPLELASLALVDARDGVSPATLDAYWWLLVVDDRACEADCEEALFTMRQLHVLLNRDAPRVRRAVVLGEAVSEQRLAELTDRYPKLTLLTRHTTHLPEGIYVMDPLGNWILHYRFGQGGKPVLEDLRKLLGASRIG